MTTTYKKETPAVVLAKEMLPEHLHAELMAAIEEYRFASLKIHGTPFVSPRVLAELILMGWRTGHR